MNEFQGSKGWKADWGIPRPGPEKPMIRLKAGQSIDSVILSASIWALTTHWNGHHSEPCTAESGPCSGCKAAFPKRWKGYLHVNIHANSNQAFIELTPTSATAIMVIAPEGEALRGLRLTMKRDSSGDNGRLHVSLWGTRIDPAILPAERDPNQVLSALWGVETITCRRLNASVE